MSNENGKRAQTTDTPDALAQLRLRMLANGYVPLPADAKGVRLDEWSKIVDGKQCGVEVTAEVITAWSKERPQDQNTGVRCGEPVVGIDVDVSDTALATKLRDLAIQCFGAAKPVRVGKHPKFLMMRRTSVPFAKLWTNKYLHPTGGDARVEVLCNGQQFIAYGIHPKTRKPYQWFGGNPETVPVAELEEVTRHQVVEFLRAAEAVLAAATGWAIDPKGATANYEEREQREQQRDYTGEPTDWAKLEAALEWLTDVEDYDTYIRIIAALKDGTDDPKRAYALAFKWAAGYPHHFDAKELQKKWDSFKRGGGVGLGTIYHLAREAERAATAGTAPGDGEADADGVEDDPVDRWTRPARLSRSRPTRRPRSLKTTRRIAAAGWALKPARLRPQH
jgi:putative DNA primase/helicase